MENKKNYFVGLDIGTDSVGYAVTDEDYALCKHRSQPMWGATLFDSAKQCDERRGFRSARRRLNRREGRIRLLQELFCGEISKTDPHFFKRIAESALFSEDRTVPPSEAFGKEYHKKYPTIHHLITHLMVSHEKEDIRYIYAACAWLTAHRGHFLNDIDADDAEQLSDITPLYDEFMQWFADNGYDTPWECDVDKFSEIISKKARIAEKEKEIYALAFGGKKPSDDAEEYPFSKAALIKLLCGGSVKPKNLLLADESAAEAEGSIKLSDAEGIETIMGELGDNAELLQKLSRIYDCAVLSKILSGYSSVSEEKVDEYNIHKKDLAELKRLIKKYRSDKFGDMFRSSAGKGYCAYSANYKSDIKPVKLKEHRNITRDDFYTAVKAVLKGIEPDGETDAKSIEDILLRMELGTYMPKQVNPDNRVIPHQLYYSELKRILKNAEAHYPFLSEKDSGGITVSDKIKLVFLFRIPYFVGPLNRHSKNAWIERKAEGKIYPWNFKNVVDFDKSEQGFIDRMTNNCSYLPGEDVIPKNSVLYCKFSVLNEINNIKIDERPITAELKQRIFNELFMPNGKNKAKVTFRRLADFFVTEGFIAKGEESRISGIDTVIKSSMKPLFDFYRLTSSGTLSAADVEEIVKHSTYTEDKRRFREWLRGRYNLNDADLRYVSSKNYSDFGRLSEKLLNGIEGVNRKTKEVGTVMHFLWETNDNLMQIIADNDKYNFRSTIEKMTKEYYSENPVSVTERLDEMGVSNAVKRPIMRVIDIMSDITKVMKCEPKKIFIEMTRGDLQGKKAGRTVSRKDALLEVYKGIKTGEAKEIIEEINSLGDEADNRLQSEKLFLYFQQMGKCAYCGRELHISQLGGEDYNIDHIWPQAYIKDDSIHNNKVLVHSEENGAKGDNYPIDEQIRTKMHDFWKYLRNANLINEEKYKRLTRNTPFSDTEKMGFINRQLVETSQSTKAVAEILKEMYPNTRIVYVKAGYVSEFRHDYGEIKERALGVKLTNEQKREMQLVKCRSINDIHHAKDAYLNIVVGNVIDERFTSRFFSVKKDKYSLKSKILFGNPIKSSPEVWDPKVHLPAVDKAMRNNYVHLTKYQTDKTEKGGGFFKQNPQRAGNNALVPRKNGLDPMKYGGYNDKGLSFFILVKYKKGKKNELTLLPVDLLIAEKFKSDKEFAAEYVRKELGEMTKNIGFPLGDRMFKINTVFSLDGFKVCLTGKSNGGKRVLMRSLETAFFTEDYTAYIKRIDNILEKKKKNPKYTVSEKFDRVSTEENELAFNYLKEKINGDKFLKMPGAHLTLGEDELEKFKNANIFEQMECIANLVLYLKTNRANTCDMQIVGASKSAGSVYLSANISNWNYSDVRIVDRSASGLYETVSQNLKELL